MKMTGVLVVFDDQEGDSLRSKLEQLSADRYEIIPIAPPSDLRNLKTRLQADAESPELFLVDYELDTRQADGSIAGYRGTTLAAFLRESYPEIPIVLLTRSTLPVWTSERRTVEAGRAFDATLYKDTDLQGDPETARAMLLSLVSGFRMLRKARDRTRSGLLDLLQTDERGRQEAERTLPPGDGWSAVEAAAWLRGVLLCYPGVLYDAAHTSVALGISAASFGDPAVHDLVGGAEYRGVFSEEGRRWWRHGLFEIADRLGSTAAKGTGSRDAFRLAASARLGYVLQRSRDGETDLPADTLCYILGIPTRIESSLPYNPDLRPPVMDRARVSFQAIRESNDVNETYLDRSSRFLLEEIRSPVP